MKALMPLRLLSKRPSLILESMETIGVEVTAVESPNGQLKDEIMISLPLPPEKELDEDPLYYYPPSTPKSQQVYEDDDTESESDSDSDEEDDEFFAKLQHENRPVIHNPRLPTSTVEEFSFMEELMQTLDTIFGCSYGGCTQTIAPPTLKSALRRKGDYSSPITPPIDRNVSFTKLEIREFNMTLGNHPNAVTGPPVMLDRTPTRESFIDLDTYELARQPRRTRKQLKLSFEARRGILEKERGFTVEEVKKAWSEALKIRKQRQETRMQAPHQRMMDEIYESAVRKYNRLFGCQ